MRVPWWRWVIAALVAVSTIGGAYFARAGVSCSVPFQLQNNTVADATQVMANYNALITCLGNAAAAGANNDITSLNALSTPIPTSGGGSTIYIGGTSTGSANVQTITSTTPTGFSLTAGKRVTFIAGFSNTAAITLNVNSLGAVNVYRRTQFGISPAVAGDIVAGQLTEAVFDGAQFQLLNQTLVGEGKEWFTTTAPAGWLLRDGSSLLRTDFPVLFAAIGTTYGAADGLHFSLPDERGRTSVMQDTAGRITTSCPSAGTLGQVCGVQGTTVQQIHLASAIAWNNTLGISDTRVWAGAQGISTVAAPSTLGQAAVAANGNNQTISVVSGSIALTGSVTSGGSDIPLPTIDPSLIVNKIIKY